MIHYHLTCCGDSLSCGVPDGMALTDLPPLAFWLDQHHGHALSVETLHPEPLPKRMPGRKRPVVAHGLQPELFALARREPGAGG